MAGAWYFPEHAELTRLALVDHAPLMVAQTIDEVIDQIRALSVRGAGDSRKVFPICRGSTTPFDVIPLESGRATCVSYGALVGLAGDHSSDTKELRAALISDTERLPPSPNVPLATLVVGAAVAVWQDFETNAPTAQLRVWTSQALGRSDAGRAIDLDGSIGQSNRRDFVRDLDARLLLIDHKYIDRAKGSKSHFHDSTASVQEILRALKQGNVDNALAQMVVHHERALQLALLAREEVARDHRDRVEKLTEALLEHAFALHFLEDGFAAGHLATDAAFVISEDRARRHDYFNRQGLAATRAIAQYRCNKSGQQEAQVRGELPLCWTAHGDGFAGVEDRLFVTEAVARLQLEFALALKENLATTLASSSCGAWTQTAGPSTGDGPASGVDGGVAPADGGARSMNSSGVFPSDTCDLWRAGLLLDAFPSWAGSRVGVSPKSPAECASIVTKVGFNIAHMTDHIPLAKPRSSDGTRSQSDPSDDQLIGEPLDPNQSSACKPSDVPNADTVPRETTNCSDREVAPQVSIWRPVLAVWPAPQGDVTTMAGADALGAGWAFQGVAGTAVSGMHPLTDSAADVSTGLGVGVGFGFAYRLDSVLPGRSGRSIFETNVGAVQAVVTGLPNETFLSLGFVEVRAPVTTVILGSIGYLWKTDSLFSWFSGWGVGIYGIRWYAQISPMNITPIGWDVEVAFWAPFTPDYSRPAAIGSELDRELRLRLGITRVGDRASQGGTQIWPFGTVGVPTVAIEFAGGYSLFL